VGLETSAEAYRDLARGFSLENPDSFNSGDPQSGLVRQLLRRFPDLTQLAPLAEATDTGAEFLAVLAQFFEGEAENADRLITVRRAEIAVLNQEIGILQVQIDAKRRLAAEKIRDQKERVLVTRAFYERLGVSETLARMGDVFARISPTNPLVLQDGTVVSSINLATLKITSDRTPGDGGADDFRAQCVFAGVMNTALCGDQHEPISFTTGGRLAYQRQGKIVDRYDFDAFVSQETDELAFESKAIKRLWPDNSRDNLLTK
jgi:predicted aspartyl protease